MAIRNLKFTLVLAVCMALPLLITAQNNPNYLYESEAPVVLSYNSPLRKPESLRSRPYFDFLSTLYRRDVDKNALFRPYARSRRSAELINAEPVASVASAPVAQAQAILPQQLEEINDGSLRAKRAILFRPLFVYRQQVVRREALKAKRRRH